MHEGAAHPQQVDGHMFYDAQEGEESLGVLSASCRRPRSVMTCHAIISTSRQHAVQSSIAAETCVP
jgi:hypothetical protein